MFSLVVSSVLLFRHAARSGSETRLVAYFLETQFMFANGRFGHGHASLEKRRPTVSEMWDDTFVATQEVEFSSGCEFVDGSLA